MKTTELPKIDYRSVTPLQGDLKDLSKENFDKLKKVLTKRGFDIPLFVWKKDGVDYILDGHQRVRVAREMDLQPYEVPYVEIEAQTEEEAKKRILEISSQYGTITPEGYQEFTAELPEAELIETVTFDAFDISQGSQEVEEDEPPEVSKEPAKSKLGEIYQLGRHRLMCGDSTKTEDVERLMDGAAKADMVFTDPPYGIDVVGDGGNIGGDTKQAPTTKFRKVIGDDTDFDPSFVLSLAPVSLIWGGNYFSDKLPKGGRWFVWDKNRPEGLSLSDCELAWSNIEGVKVQKFKSTWDGYHVEGEKSGRVHPNQKPLKLLSEVIAEVSDEEWILLDLFLGSGSTLIACEMTNRTCYGMELDPKYCDVIRKRYHKLVTGEEGWEEATPQV